MQIPLQKLLQRLKNFVKSSKNMDSNFAKGRLVTMKSPVHYLINSEITQTKRSSWKLPNQDIRYFMETQLRFLPLLLECLLAWLDGITKRKLLSETAKIYDPVGCLAPIIINFKVMLQKLWVQRVGWDDILPPNVGKAVWFVKFDQRKTAALHSYNRPNWKSTIKSFHRRFRSCICRSSLHTNN